jgi:hypothetical protein
VLVAAGTSVYAGGAFYSIGGSSRRGFAVFTSLGDAEGDGDIDLPDYAVFGECLAGPGISVGYGCEVLDLDQDTDIDLHDFRQFQLAFTGAP